MPIVIHYCHNYFVVFFIFSHFLHFKWNIFEYYCRNCLKFLSGIFDLGGNGRRHVFQSSRGTW